MKRAELRMIEDQIRSLNNGQYNPTQEHIDEVVRRAHDELLRRERVKSERQAKRKNCLRRVVVAAAVMVSFMVISFFYNALAPASVGSASNVFRRAAIWINNTLHLGMEFSEPIDDDAKLDIADYTTFNTLEEAAKRLKAPVIYLENADDFSINSISASKTVANGQSFTLKYEQDNKIISLTSYPISESGFISLDDDSYTEIETKIGNVYMSEIEDGVRGMLPYQDYIITVKSNLDKDVIVPYVQNLNVLN